MVLCGTWSETSVAQSQLTQFWQIPRHRTLSYSLWTPFFFTTTPYRWNLEVRQGPEYKKNLERFSTYWYTPFCRVSLDCCAVEFGNPGGTYEQPCTFPNYIINGTIFEKQLPNIKRVFWFSLQYLSEKFLILKRIQWLVTINVHTSSKVPVYSCQVLMKIGFSLQFCEKYSNFKFHENPSSGSRAVPCGQTDRQRTNVTKLIIAFHNFANAPKN